MISPRLRASAGERVPLHVLHGGMSRSLRGQSFILRVWWLRGQSEGRSPREETSQASRVWGRPHDCIVRIPPCATLLVFRLFTSQQGVCPPIGGMKPSKVQIPTPGGSLLIPNTLHIHSHPNRRQTNRSADSCDLALDRG